MEGGREEVGVRELEGMKGGEREEVGRTGKKGVREEGGRGCRRE